MKTILKLEPGGQTRPEEALIERLRDVISSSDPSIKAWIMSHIEAVLTDIPFRQASLTNTHPPPKEITPNRVLSPQEAGILLNIPVRWIYRHLNKLPHIRLGKYIRFRERELLRWAEKQRNASE